MRVLVLQGPNLNRLGTREPERYGSTTLAQLQAHLDEVAASLGCTLEHVQSNHEGALVDAVHRCIDEGVDAAIVNAGAYTHTSVALRDAFLSGPLPFVEVHVSNVYAREPFRHHSYLSDIAIGVVAGLGTVGYPLALRALVARASAG